MQTPSFRLDGRRALVTGGSKGIGLAAAHALVQAGAQVMIVARNAPELIAASEDLIRAESLKRIESSVKSQLVVQQATLDVTDARAVDAFFEQQAPFDVVINNAGTNRPKPLTEASDDDLDAVIDLNVKAAFYVVRAAARRMLRVDQPAHSRSIVNISSQMGHVGAAKRTLYCASKHAIEGMTKALAWELGAHNIRVNTICPTFIETPMTAPMLADEVFKKSVVNRIALGRIGRLEEVMGAVTFLASEASSLVTGSALMLDGGWTAQ
jgi:NAD(P)-dependent dehydrogenase (short-subunit alcohol dehydrogenase family)